MGPRPQEDGWKFGTRSFRAGETVFVEGDLASEAYIIESGVVDIVKTRRDSRGGAILGSLGAGAVFGEMAMVDDVPRMASAVCTEDCVLRVIPVDVFEAKMKSADPFLRAVLRVLVHNARANASAFEVTRP